MARPRAHGGQHAALSASGRRLDALIATLLVSGASLAQDEPPPEQGSHEQMHRTVRYSFNMAWSPIHRVDLIGEILSGQRLDKDGKKGSATQIQFGTRFRF